MDEAEREQRLVESAQLRTRQMKDRQEWAMPSHVVTYDFFHADKEGLWPYQVVYFVCDTGDIPEEAVIFGVLLKGTPFDPSRMHRVDEGEQR